MALGPSDRVTGEEGVGGALGANPHAFNQRFIGSYRLSANQHALVLGEDDMSLPSEGSRT